MGPVARDKGLLIVNNFVMRATIISGTAYRPPAFRRFRAETAASVGVDRGLSGRGRGRGATISQTQSRRASGRRNLTFTPYRVPCVISLDRRASRHGRIQFGSRNLSLSLSLWYFVTFSIRHFAARLRLRGRSTRPSYFASWASVLLCPLPSDCPLPPLSRGSRRDDPRVGLPFPAEKTWIKRARHFAREETDRGRKRVAHSAAR